MLANCSSSSIRKTRLEDAAGRVRGSLPVTLVPRSNPRGNAKPVDDVLDQPTDPGVIDGVEGKRVLTELCMLEKIGAPGFESLSKPDTSVLKYLDAVLAANPEPVFYEIGVGVGATTLPVADRLNNRGEIVLFSRERHVRELAEDLAARGYTNVNSAWGSPTKVYSGYHFELARGSVSGALPRFDLAYIDGGHVYHLDAPAACLLKELCKPGGYMLFDDWGWSLAMSPTMNPQQRPATSDEYDDRQIESCHVQLVCQTIMDVDDRFRSLGVESGTAVYQHTA